MFGNEVQPILITSPTADHVCITTSSDSDYNAQVVFKYYGSDYNIIPKPNPQSPLHIKLVWALSKDRSLFLRSIDPAHLTGSFDSSIALITYEQYSTIADKHGSFATSLDLCPLWSFFIIIIY
jgi:hypothetical protein